MPVTFTPHWSELLRAQKCLGKERGGEGRNNSNKEQMFLAHYKGNRKEHGPPSCEDSRKLCLLHGQEVWERVMSSRFCYFLRLKSWLHCS